MTAPNSGSDDIQTVQDAVRERLMRERFGLLDSGQGRMGADAVDVPLMRWATNMSSSPRHCGA